MKLHEKADFKLVPALFVEDSLNLLWSKFHANLTKTVGDKFKEFEKNRAMNFIIPATSKCMKTSANLADILVKVAKS